MKIIRLGTLLAVASGFALALLLLPAEQPASFTLPEISNGDDASDPVMEAAFVSGELTREVHSATAVELNNGDIRVFWYGGKREGSKDTAIYSRVFSNSTAGWSEIHEVMSRRQVTQDTRRYIRKLGNPVAVVKDDELWLFFVTVSVGGWAGSSINLSVSTDNGNSWGPVKRLISTPFMNISTLVRNAPLLTEQGDVMLPAYHEFIGKFSELLRIDNSGTVIDKYRISHGREAIQPALLATDPGNAIAFMRNSSEKHPGKLWFSHTDGSLADWTPLAPMPLPNPDSAATVVQLDAADELLLVFNNHPSERDDITMAWRPAEDADWQLIHQFENLAEGEKIHNPFSYPFLLKTSRGDFHLFYTWKRKYIKHVHFNRAALQKMRADAGMGS
ncbi:MAG: exo-alpha-sialidase [Gammaproteobacteria bacterium]|nr:exo-alpha-sialidase [Gammaproteobacteria bacterium]